MMHACRLKDGSPELEGERLLGASSSSPLLGLKGPLEEDLGVSHDLFAEGDLAELTLLIAIIIVQRQASGIEAHEGAAQWRSSVLESEGATTINSGFDLAFHTSKVTQRQLGTFHT